MLLMQLTLSLLRMIELNRLKMRLDNLKKLLLKKVRMEKEIQRNKDLIIKAINHDAQQIRMAENFLKDFDAGWYIKIKLYTQNYKILGLYTDPNWNTTNNFNREILWSEEITRKLAIITNEKYDITVKLHIVYSGRYMIDKHNAGYKMFLNRPVVDYSNLNRAYVKVNTVLKRIKLYLDNVEREARRKTNRLTNLLKRIKMFQLTITNSTVTSGKFWDRDLKQLYDKIAVKLQNNITFTYKMYSDGALTLITSDFGKIPLSTILNTLNSIVLELEKK